MTFHMSWGELQSNMKFLQSWEFFLLGQVLQGVQQKVQQIEVLHTTVKMRSNDNKNLKNFKIWNYCKWHASDITAATWLTLVDFRNVWLHNKEPKVVL